MILQHINKPEFDPNVPIYFQIMNFVKKLIVRGILKPGDKIPSVRDMAVFLGVNPNTVQKAYEELEREGILFIKRGLGNFVSEDENLVENLKIIMVKEMLQKQIGELLDLGLSKEEIKKIIEEILYG